ncbi:unnamed protein product [Periconia digitata]|uniref:Uncharacterized protein n=1 Tax=Periconia digitata TaxID=1303443 RepID=A0A9W4UB48_9PLEO|nr:unnamed protein product [Periconia digitata]
MAPVERITYFAYNEGIDPSRLPLGTIVFDYANARLSRHSYRPSEDEESVLKESKYIDEDKRSFCNMLWTQKSDGLLNIDLKKVIEAGHSTSKSDTRLIVGKAGSKVEIIDSDKFFDDHLLKQEAVRQWFETRFSVARSITAAVNNLVKAPHVWLLTGKYVIEDGTVFSVRKESSSSHTAAKVPVPEPSGLSDLAGLKVGVTVRLGNGVEAQASTQIEGRKVWAAQWIKVKARYVANSKAKSDSATVVQTLELHDVWSTGTTRRWDDEAPALQLEKVLDDTAEIDDSSSFDEAWWDRFEDKLAEHLEDLEIEE